MDAMQKGFSTILVVLAAIVVIGTAGYFLFVRQYCEAVADDFIVCTKGYIGKVLQKSELSSSPVESSRMPSPTNQNGTKDWKTYRNGERGFEINYPPSWSTRFFDSGAGYFGINFINKASDTTAVSIDTTTKFQNGNLEEFYEEGCEIVKIDNERAYKCPPTAMSDAHYFLIFIHNQVRFIISDYIQNDESSLFVSTFKFIK